jgi:hypothetical protein
LPTAVGLPSVVGFARDDRRKAKLVSARQRYFGKLNVFTRNTAICPRVFELAGQ